MAGTKTDLPEVIGSAGVGQFIHGKAEAPIKTVVWARAPGIKEPNSWPRKL